MINNKPHILIVDDDSRILKLLQQFLQQNNFLVSTSLSAEKATEMMANFNYDLIILDVMMPEVTGIEFAQEIKSRGTKMPIVMLTALSEPEDKIKGLEAGANDYVTKPFEPRELLLRINNLIESHQLQQQAKKIIRFGNIHYNLATKELKKNDANINLSTSEQKLLEVLIDASSKPISREELSNIMGGLNPRSVDVQIVRLRGKIESDPKIPKFLKTIRNQGYVLYF